MNTYTYHAPHLLQHLRQIRQWCWDEHIPCTRYGTTWIFESSEHRMWFQLRWA